MKFSRNDDGDLLVGGARRRPRSLTRGKARRSTVDELLPDAPSGPSPRRTTSTRRAAPSKSSSWAAPKA